MNAYYTYLISSLPALSFSSKLPFSLEDFFAKCKGLVPEEKIDLLRAACQQEPHLLQSASGHTLGKWAHFETALRNELIRARAHRKKIDPLAFVRLPDYPDAHISHAAISAYRSTSVLEAEKILDLERWNFLEFLNISHYFDFDSLLVYALKLKIMERWDKIQSADKESLFNATIRN